MSFKEFKVTKENTIHARTAAAISSICMNCDSRVEMSIGQNSVNPASIYEIMARPIIFDTIVTITCDGETEEEDMNKIMACLSKYMEIAA